MSGFVVARRVKVLGVEVTEYLVGDSTRSVEQKSKDWTLWRYNAKKYPTFSAAEKYRTSRRDYVETA